MAPLWGRLGELQMPVTVIAGERDAKFQALGQRMVDLLPDADLIVVPGGHGLPLENPAAVARVLEQTPETRWPPCQSGSTPSPGADGSAILPARTGSSSSTAPSNILSVASPHAGTGPREASAAAACSAAATPSGPSRVEATYASAPEARTSVAAREQA